MGEYVKLREATERANMSLQAVQEIAEIVNNNANRLEMLAQAFYELAQRHVAVEMVLTRYLDQNSTLTFSEILSQHIAETQARKAGVNADNTTESTDTITEADASRNP